MKSALILVLSCIGYSFCKANDTLYFHLSNPYASTKDAAGKFVRKAIMTKDSGWLAIDYNDSNRLVAMGHFTDTNFRTKIFAHHYFNTVKGFHSLVRTYANGKLDGVTATFNSKGDTMWRQTYNQGKLVSQWFNPEYGLQEATYDQVEVESEFPGGATRWQHYLGNNLQYPKQAIKKEIQGMVIVLFIVSSKGEVTNVEVIQSVNPLLDAEAMRLIKASPNWTPSKWDGMKVAHWLAQPVVFKLEEEVKMKKG